MTTTQIGGNPATTQSGQAPQASTAITAAVTGTTITPVPQAGGLTVAVPDWMLPSPGEVDTTKEFMDEFVSPPRLKLIQGSSAQALKREFGESAIIVQPENKIVSEALSGEQLESVPFKVVPIFQWKEYICWNPIPLPAGLMAIRERSVDENSALARKCTPKEWKDRDQPCPEDTSLKIKYREHINFVFLILDPLGFDLPVAMSFHDGSYTEGAKLCKLAKTIMNLKLYAQVFELSCSPRTKNGNDYYGWNVRHAVSPEGLVDHVGSYFKRLGSTDEEAQQWYGYVKQLHEEFREKYLKDVLRATDAADSPDVTERPGTIDTTASSVPM